MRYFIVFYEVYDNGFHIYVSHHKSFEQDSYPNRREIESFLTVEQGYPRLTNIIELKEQDYQEWIR